MNRLEKAFETGFAIICLASVIAVLGMVVTVFAEHWLKIVQLRNGIAELSADHVVVQEELAKEKLRNEVLLAEIEVARASSRNLTADLTAERFLDALDAVYACGDEPTCLGPTDEIADMLLLTCSLGWHQASELMTESEVNYENCQRELDDGVTSYRVERLERNLRWCEQDKDLAVSMLDIERKYHGKVTQ